MCQARLAMSSRSCLSVCLSGLLACQLHRPTCLCACDSMRLQPGGVHAEHLRNGAFTPTYASPMLIQYLGSRQLPVMNDMANDVWAMGVVLFELIMSTEGVWKKNQGPFMFGPRPKDLKGCTSGSSNEQISKLRMAVQREQSQWVKSLQQAVLACAPALLYLTKMNILPHLQPL